jgi:hypothetical protein
MVPELFLLSPNNKLPMKLFGSEPDLFLSEITEFRWLELPIPRIHFDSSLNSFIGNLLLGDNKNSSGSQGLLDKELTAKLTD